MEYRERLWPVSQSLRQLKSGVEDSCSQQCHERVLEWKNRKTVLKFDQALSSITFTHISSLIYVALISNTYFPNHRWTAKDLPLCSRIFSLSTENFNKCTSLKNENKIFKVKDNANEEVLSITESITSVAGVCQLSWSGMKHYPCYYSYFIRWLYLNHNHSDLGHLGLMV